MLFIKNIPVGNECLLAWYAFSLSHDQHSTSTSARRVLRIICKNTTQPSFKKIHGVRICIYIFAYLYTYINIYMYTHGDLGPGARASFSFKAGEAPLLFKVSEAAPLTF